AGTFGVHSVGWMRPRPNVPRASAKRMPSSTWRSSRSHLRPARARTMTAGKARATKRWVLRANSSWDSTRTRNRSNLTANPRTARAPTTTSTLTVTPKVVRASNTAPGQSWRSTVARTTWMALYEGTVLAFLLMGSGREARYAGRSFHDGIATRTPIRTAMAGRARSKVLRAACGSTGRLARRP